ncbi:MAG: HAD family hydrolase [Chlamydiota bacterium]
MWIIFDLDDTLVDTSGSITPVVLQRAFAAIQQAGGVFKNPEKAYRDLIAINEQSISSRLALASFSACYGISKQDLERGISALSDSICWDLIAPVTGATKVLSRLAQTHQLALVTRGKSDIQLKKMICAGIDPKLFQKCYFCPMTNKKKSYRKFALETAASPNNIWVCGDRISFDLTPAKELGYHTVQLKWGRGRGNTGLKSDVDYTISYLEELETLIPTS